MYLFMLASTYVRSRILKGLCEQVLIVCEFILKTTISERFTTN